MPRESKTRLVSYLVGALSPGVILFQSSTKILHLVRNCSLFCSFSQKQMWMGSQLYTDYDTTLSFNVIRSASFSPVPLNFFVRCVEDFVRWIPSTRVDWLPIITFVWADQSEPLLGMDVKLSRAKEKVWFCSQRYRWQIESSLSLILFTINREDEP